MSVPPPLQNQNNSVPTTAESLRLSLNRGEPSYDPNYLSRLGLSEDPVEKEFIGLDRALGITITRGSPPRFESKELDGSNASTWLQEAQSTRSSDQVSVKLLWGEQAYPNDGLRPPKLACSYLLSRAEIAKSLDLQPMAIERLGTDVPWEMNLPTELSASASVIYYGLGAHCLNMTWSYDIVSRTTYAFVVLRRVGTRDEEQVFMQYIEDMKHLCHLPRFLPYVIASTEAALLSKSIIRFERQIAQNSRLLYRPHQNNGDPLLQFTATTGVLETLLLMQQNTPFVINMAKSDVFEISVGTTGSTTATIASPPQSVNQSVHNDDNLLLQRALTSRVQELNFLTAGASSLRERTANHISSILGVINIQQQKTSQDIATATREDGRLMKDIAEATKNDSSSMKVLAVMAALYLPVTTVATIMSMPMFDWDAEKHGSVVNPRFWIYFVVSIPLTALTMCAFWLWAGIERSGKKPMPQVSSLSKQLKTTLLPQFIQQKRQRLGKVV